MFNVTGGEIIMILVLALIVLGPEKLPDAIRRFGRTYGEIKRMSAGFQQEFRQAFDEPVRELRQTADLVRKTIEEPLSEVTNTVRSEVDAAVTATRDAVNVAETPQSDVASEPDDESTVDESVVVESVAADAVLLTEPPVAPVAAYDPFGNARSTVGQAAARPLPAPLPPPPAGSMPAVDQPAPPLQEPATP